MRNDIKLLIFFVEALNPKLAKLLRQTASLACNIAEVMKLEPKEVKDIEMAGMVHDIGLLSLPKEIQNKDVKLMSDEQYRLYCEHPIIASITLENVNGLSDVGEIVLYHHEYMNGKGFPNGLSGDQIPISSRILLVASEYSRILTFWPRDMRKLLSYARRHLAGDDWQNFSYSDDPDDIVEESAEKILLKDPEEKYDAKVVKALIKMVHKKKNIAPTHGMDLSKLTTDMTLMESLYKDNGRLLMAKGTKLSIKSIQTLQNLGDEGIISQQVNVSFPDKN